jgi:hypothetical protein
MSDWTTPPFSVARALEVSGRQIVVCIYVMLVSFAGAAAEEYFAPFWGAALGYYFLFWVLMDDVMGCRAAMFDE